MAKKQISNDNKIMDLRAQIEVKKAALAKSAVFLSKTNCNLQIGAERVNIRAESSRQKLIELLVQVNALHQSAMALGFHNEYRLSGYSTSAWLDDLTARLDFISRKAEEDRLAQLEAQLHNLLSLDKKVEIELDGIANQIKG